MKINSYRKLIVWEKSMDLVILVYKLTENFPNSEIYGLSAQMKRSSVSIPSNIAEGSKRGSKKDYRHFLVTAFGSGAELETQIEITKRLNFVDQAKIHEVEVLLDEVMRMLNSIIYKLQPTT